MKAKTLSFCQCDGYAKNKKHISRTICNKCNRPKAEWYYTCESDILNAFYGGALDGKVYEVEDIMGSPVTGNRIHTENYERTNDVVSVCNTSILARVWILKKDDIVYSQAKNNTKERPTMAEDSQEDISTPLLDRRKKLKLSRSKVANQAGVTQAKLARIESGGKRTTDEEFEAVKNALDALTPVEVKEEASDPS